MFCYAIVLSLCVWFFISALHYFCLILLVNPFIADDCFIGNGNCEVWKTLHVGVFYSLNWFKEKTHLHVGFSNIDSYSKFPACKGLEPSTHTKYDQKSKRSFSDHLHPKIWQGHTKLSYFERRGFEFYKLFFMTLIILLSNPLYFYILPLISFFFFQQNSWMLIQRIWFSIGKFISYKISWLLLTWGVE